MNSASELSPWLEALSTQAKLQDYLEKVQGVSPRPSDVYLAVVAEMGEVLNTIKVDWAWWKRKDKAFSQYDLEDAIEELSDVLHFLLILVLQNGGAERLRKDFLVASHGSTDSREGAIDATLHQAFKLSQGDPTVNTFVLLKNLTNILPGGQEALLESYQSKAQANMDRWNI